MIVTRTSIITGITRERDLDITQYQLDQWRCGVLVQHAMPHLNADDREFIKTGIVQEEWDDMCEDL